jgi:small subunit ribosomal protein S1
MVDDDLDMTEEESGEDFAALLEQSFKGAGRLTPGQQLTARVLKISNEWIFIDTGRKGEGVLDRKELLDAEGNLTVAEGDQVTAWFLGGGGGEMRFTTRIGGGGGGGASGSAQLEEAWRSGIPVEGTVEKEVKGGLEVKVAGNRAFCPFSQVGLRRTDDTAALVGRTLSFRITEYAENGRNIVVSRRALLEEEQQRERDALRERLETGTTVEGTVTSLRDFGAFVDIGGIEGLIPMAEMAWGRVKSAGDVLTVGDRVKVVIKQLDWERQRISLSLRDTQADPWERAVVDFPEGSFQTGTVSRLAPFGAFVTLAGGLDGLLHISKLGAGKRINHPREVIQEGDVVEVKVEGVDREQKRLSLALAGPARAAAEEAETMASFRAEAATESGSMGTLGELLKARQEKAKK